MKASSPCHRLPQNLPLLSSTLLSSNPKMALPNQPSLLKTNSICDVVKSVEKFIPIIYIYIVMGRREKEQARIDGAMYIFTMYLPFVPRIPSVWDFMENGACVPQHLAVEAL